ncbi:hypothetical protein ACP4OV_014653 [Aristida adscensionis]
MADVVVSAGAAAAAAACVFAAAVAAAGGAVGFMVAIAVTVPVVGSAAALCYGVLDDVTYGVGGTSAGKVG